MLCALGLATIPLSRTVELDGRLVPEHAIAIRPLLDGLVAEVFVAPGDTVVPGQLLARLYSPERAAAHPRRSYLAHHDVYSPTSLYAGVVLSEDLDRLLGMHLDAGDLLLELAALDANGASGSPSIPFTIRAYADEHRAQRVRPGMPARLTFPAIPTERPRQGTGRVLRVGPSPESTASERWRIEIAPDSRALDVITREPSHRDGLPTRLYLGFSVEIAVEERRETVALTSFRWIWARLAKMGSAVQQR